MLVLSCYILWFHTKFAVELAIFKWHDFSTMDLFKKANIKAMLQIEKDSKEKLLRRRDDSLISSSESVYGTQEELKFTGSAITQSGKLLAKYGRREFTDKILVWFAFLFFCFCVFYIVQNRLFWSINFLRFTKLLFYCDHLSTIR